MNDEKKVIISLEISEDLKEQLRVEAFNKRMTVSALIRKYITEKLAEGEEN